MLSARSVMSFAVAAVVTLPTAAAAQQVTFTKDVAPILQRSCRAAIGRGDRADVAHDVRAGAAVGARDQDARGVARDAAVARRQDDRDHEVQERSVALGRRDRDDRRSGWTPARRRATPPTCRRRRQFAEAARLADWQAGSRHQVPGVHRARRRARPVRRTAGRHPDRRGSLHQSHPDALGDARVAQSGAPRPVLLGRPDRSTACTRTAASSWSSTPRARTPRCIPRVPACCSSRASRRA